MNGLLKLRKELNKLVNPQKAKVLQRFFKTGKGEYGEGDVFLGITVPESRKISIKFKTLSFLETTQLLKSKIHEERLIALLILVNNFSHFAKAPRDKQEKIYNFYLKNTKYINNWDLVDLSADKIVGGFLFHYLGSTHSLNNSSEPSGNTSLTYENKSKSPAAKLYKHGLRETVKRSFREESHPSILLKLASSKNIWERRIAMVATYYFIKNKKFDATLKIAEILLNDKHDLIQKAVGWMLREVGKRDLQTEIKFLDQHYKKMPRTILRYSIEKFPKKLRLDFLTR